MNHILKTCIFIMAICFIVCCRPQNHYSDYTLKIGNLNSTLNDSEIIYLKKIESGKYSVKDSFIAKIKGGQFIVKKKNDTPFMAILSTKRYPFLTKMFVVTNTSIKIDILENQISGGENDFMTQNFFLFSLPKDIRLNALLDNNSLSSKTIGKEKFNDENLENAFNRYQEDIYRVVKENPSSFFVLYQLEFYHQNISLKTLERCLSVINVKLRSTVQYKNLVDYLKHAGRKFIGEDKLSYLFKDVENNPIKLGNILSKKRYTIIDFWASWCMPCREQFKKLSEIAEATDKNHFQFITFSCDTNLAAWKRASDQEKNNWLDISDLKGFRSNGLVNYLGIEHIPKLIILDNQGNIIEQSSVDSLRLQLSRLK
jgi:thiol-disulfide isomerase/thioredoxin